LRRCPRLAIVRANESRDQRVSVRAAAAFMLLFVLGDSRFSGLFG
jgi:hypothetical protein